MTTRQSTERSYRMTTNPAEEAVQLAGIIQAGQDAWAIHHAQQAIAEAQQAGVGVVDAERELAEARGIAHRNSRQATHAINIARGTRRRAA